MIRKIQLVFLFLLFYAVSFAQKTGKANEIVIHKVEKGQTVYSIAKMYGLTPNQLQLENPTIDSTFNIKDGQLLRIEIRDEHQLDQVRDKLDKNPIYHKVEAKETVYSISKQYNLDIEKIQKWNEIEDNRIKIGQDVIVGWRYTPKKSFINAQASNSNATPAQAENQPKINATPAAAPTPPSSSSSPSSVSTPPVQNIELVTTRNIQDVLKERYTAELSGKPSSKKEGFAIWFNSDNRTMASRYYGLYTGVPVGSIIKVTNLFNNKVVWVKVIGSLPNTAENNGALVKLTPPARKTLIGNDTKVRVRVESASN